MKKFIIHSMLFFIMLLNVSPAVAQSSFLDVLKGIGKAVVSVAVGSVESYVGSSVPDEYKSSYNDMVSSFNSNVGIDNSYANAGSNWQQGKKSDAILDLTEGVALSTNTSGTFLVSTILDIGHAQNNYKNNLASGMTKEEATSIRNQELERYAERVYDDYIMSDKDKEEIYRYNEMQYTKELKEQDRALRSEIWHELLRRGYSIQEAGVYMTIIDENPGMLSGLYEESDNSIYMTGVMLTEDTSVLGMIERRAKKSLDNLNITDRSDRCNLKIEQSNDNLNVTDGTYENHLEEKRSSEKLFFGTEINPVEPLPKPMPSIKQSEVDTVEVSNTPKIPNDFSLEAKTRLREISPDRYLLNHVGLNKKQKETLDEVVSLLKQYPNIKICLNGNTCDLGSEYINELIAIKRANNAKAYLVENGIEDNRIIIESKASSEPIVYGHTKEARLRNRRVTISIVNE